MHILVYLSLFLALLNSALAGGPTLSDDGNKLIYSNNSSIVNCDSLTPERVLLAIYINHQLTSLSDQVSEKQFNLNDMKAILARADHREVNKIDIIPLNLDFSTWPNLDARSFDQHALIGKGKNAKLVDRKTLANIVARLKAGDPTLETIPSKDQIQKAIWETYTQYELNAQEPEETLKIALDKYTESNRGSKTPFAIDLGSGTGRDTRVLLNRGWTVLAIDFNKTALEHLAKTASGIKNGKLLIQNTSFETMNLDEISHKVDLVNSSYTLPYAGPLFERTLNKISEKLAPGGLFAGQLFGPNDDLAKTPGVAVHQKEQIHDLFKGFDILYFKEKESEGTRVDGGKKHWHVLDIVARKKL